MPPMQASAPVPHSEQNFEGCHQIGSRRRSPASYIIGSLFKPQTLEHSVSVEAADGAFLEGGGGVHNQNPQLANGPQGKSCFRLAN